MQPQAITRKYLHNIICLTALFLAASISYAHAAPSITSSDVPMLTAPKTAEPASPVKAEAPPAAMPEPVAAPASGNQVTIGMLLPLSGPQAAVGKALLDAATLALYDMQRNKPLGHPVPDVRFVPKDTHGTPEGAQEAMRQFMEMKPAAILGPLSSAELEIILPLRRELNIPLISFTNNPTLANRGAYQFGYFAQEQAERLAHYATAQQVTSVAAVTMADGYGRIVVDHMAKALREQNVAYGPTILLPPQGAIQDRQLAPLLAALKERQNQRQFLFIAETSPRLETIVIALAKARLLQPNLVLAGSGIWDEAAQLASPALRGAVFVSTPKESYTKFQTKYKTTYGTMPLRISSLAYDASALLVSLLYGGDGSTVTDRSLQDHEGFTTPANGLVRFRTDGQAERRLAIYMGNGTGGSTVLEKAPTSFDAQ